MSALERVIEEQQTVIDALRSQAERSHESAIRQAEAIDKSCQLLQRLVYLDDSSDTARQDARLFLAERGWCWMCESFYCEGHYD